MAIQLRPEHIPHILYLLEKSSKERRLIISSEYSEYSQDILYDKLHEIEETETFVIVPSIDFLCVDCPTRERCQETDATLFAPLNRDLKKSEKHQKYDLLRKFLDNVPQNDFLLAQAFPFTHLIGKSYDLEQLYHIRDHPEEVLGLV